MYIKLSDYFFGEDWGDLVYCFYMGDFEGMKDIIEYLEVI